MEKLVKYVYQIRSHNGVVVSHLQIYGHTEPEARARLEQMYPRCEILEFGIATTEHHGHSSYEDVLDFIVKE